MLLNRTGEFTALFFVEQGEQLEHSGMHVVQGREHVV